MLDIKEFPKYLFQTTTTTTKIKLNNSHSSFISLPYRKHLQK